MKVPPERVQYRKLPGHWRGFLRSYSLWMGPDHLLFVRSLRFREEYKRFHLRDIQSIVVAPAPRFHISTRALGVACLWLVFSLVSVFASTWTKVVAGSSAVCLIGAWFYISLARSCRCHIQTAVSREALPSVSRTWTARKFLAEVEPRITEAQGALAEDWVAALQARPVEPSAPVAGSPGAFSQPQKLERQPARRHTVASNIFVGSLFADAALNLATLHSLTRTMQWIWYGLAFVELACAILIFVEHQRGVLRAGMQKLAISTVIAMGAIYYFRQVIAGLASATLSMVPDPALLASLPAYTVLREVDAAICLGLGIAGVALVLTGGPPQSPQIDGRLIDS